MSEVMNTGEAEAGGELDVVSTGRNSAQEGVGDELEIDRGAGRTMAEIGETGILREVVEQEAEMVEAVDDLVIDSGAGRAMVEVNEAEVAEVEAVREPVGEELKVGAENQPDVQVGDEGEIEAGNQPGIQGGMEMEVGGVDEVIGGDDLVDIEERKDEVAKPAESGGEEEEQRGRLEEVVVVTDGDDEEEVPEMPMLSPDHLKGTRAEDFIFFHDTFPEADITEAEVVAH